MRTLTTRIEKATEFGGTVTFMAGDAGVTLPWSQLHDEARATAAALQARGVSRGDHVAILGPTPLPYLINAPAILHNVPVLEKAAAGTGLLTHYPEFDGVVRRLPAAYRTGNKVILPLALELLRVATGGSTVRALLESLGLGDTLVAVERNREIVPRAQHATATLSGGDHVEVVHFVGGG